MGPAQRGPGRKCWPAAAKLSSGGQTAGGVKRDGVGGWLRALLQEPLESRAERSVLIISVCVCVRVHFGIVDYICMFSCLRCLYVCVQRSYI